MTRRSGIIETTMITKIKLLLCCIIIFGVPLGNAGAKEWTAPSTNLAALTLTLQCPNAGLRMGDEIPIEFVISNGGTADFTYANPAYDRSGRIAAYEIIVKTPAGQTLPDLDFRGFSGGLFGTGLLHPGETFAKTIPLNLWAMPPTAGQYRITGVYHGSLGSFGQAGVPSAPITLTILPRTDAEMDAYLNSLTNHGGVDWRRLAFTGSPKIVPFLLDGMYHGGDSFWISKALAVYLPHTDEIEAQVVAAVSKWGLVDGLIYVVESYHLSEKQWVPLIAQSLRADSPGTWEAGARAAAPGHYDDTLTARLIAIATGTNDASDAAIWALAMNRTDASVATLQTLLNSPHEAVRLTTEKAICAAYCYRGYYYGQKLKPDDFDKKFQDPATYLALVQGKSKP